MFYVSKIEDNGRYFVTDTADGVTECLSHADLIRAVDKGICIEGVIEAKKNGKKDIAVLSDDLFTKVVSEMGQPVYLVWGRNENEHLFALYVGLIFDKVMNENYLCLYNSPEAFDYMDESLYRRTSIDGIIAVSAKKIIFTHGMFIKPARHIDSYGITTGFNDLRKSADLNSIRLL